MYTYTRRDRKHLPDLPDNTVSRGESAWRMDPSGISVTKWVDTKPVMSISNMHNPSDMGSVSR